MRVRYKAGPFERTINDKVGSELVRRGLVQEVMGYQTREMRAVTSTPKDDPEAMKAELDRRGIKYHHRAGVTKLRELLEG